MTSSSAAQFTTAKKVGDVSAKTPAAKKNKQKVPEASVNLVALLNQDDKVK